MHLYTNRTRFPAIVTVKIEVTGQPLEAVLIGETEFFENFSAKVGYFDFLVDGGKELHLGENTVGTVVGVRCAT
jgi:hypothetical protein